MIDDDRATITKYSNNFCTRLSSEHRAFVNIVAAHEAGTWRNYVVPRARFGARNDAGGNRIMKQPWLWLTALLMTGHCGSLYAESVAGIDFPSAPAGFELRSVIDNEASNPGLGVTFLYNAPGVKASVFVYDDSQPSIPDGIASAAARDQFATAIGHIKQFYPDARSLTRETKLTIAGIPLLYTAFQYTEVQPGSRETAMSHLYLTAYKGSFIKVRVTYSGVDRPDLGYRTQVNFVEALFGAIAD